MEVVWASTIEVAPSTGPSAGFTSLRPPSVAAAELGGVIFGSLDLKPNLKV